VRRIAALILHSPCGETPAEQLVGAARRAFALDLVGVLRDAEMSEILISPADESFGSELQARGLTALPSGADEFHFGEVVRRVVRERRLDGLLYFGSGCGGLLSGRQVRQLIAFASRAEPAALLNNFYSCDFAAISRAEALLDVELPPIDNPLGLVLADHGIPCHSLPRDAASQFDIDTPTDVLLLAHSGRGGDAIRALVAERRLSHPDADRLCALLSDRTSWVYLLGRVSPQTWRTFEQAVACRTGGVIEGRGMRAAPADREPLLCQALRDGDVEVFFERLSRAADGAIIDTRPFLARHGELPPAAVRFASDLLRPEEVEDPLWAAFTRCARDAAIPVLLGGHSLVSGGLLLLSETCWKGRDLARRLHPETIEWQKESR